MKARLWLFSGNMVRFFAARFVTFYIMLFLQNEWLSRTVVLHCTFIYRAIKSHFYCRNWASQNVKVSVLNVLSSNHKTNWKSKCIGKKCMETLMMFSVYLCMCSYELLHCKKKKYAEQQKQYWYISSRTLSIKFMHTSLN